jgi:hypothetical protein
LEVRSTGKASAGWIDKVGSTGKASAGWIDTGYCISGFHLPRCIQVVPLLLA